MSIPHQRKFEFSAGTRVPATSLLIALATTTVTAFPIEPLPVSRASLSLPPFPAPCNDTWYQPHDHSSALDSPWDPRPPPTPPAPPSPSQTNWSDGTMAGLVVGLFAFVFILVCGGYLLRDRCRRQRQQQQQQKCPNIAKHLDINSFSSWRASYASFASWWWWTPSNGSSTHVGERPEHRHMYPLPPVCEDDDDDHDDDDQNRYHKPWLYTRGAQDSSDQTTPRGPLTATTTTSSSLQLPPTATTIDSYEHCCTPLYTIREYAASSDSSLASWLECPPIPHQALMQQQDWHQSSPERPSHQLEHEQTYPALPRRPDQACCHWEVHHHHHRRIQYRESMDDGNEADIESAFAGYSSSRLALDLSEHLE